MAKLHEIDDLDFCGSGLPSRLDLSAAKSGNSSVAGTSIAEVASGSHRLTAWASSMLLAIREIRANTFGHRAIELLPLSRSAVRYWAADVTPSGAGGMLRRSHSQSCKLSKTFFSL